MLIFGAAVIFLRSPVSSALSLVMSFVFLAAFFVTLDAFFIGVVQVLVYAGAVMVLFLFIIMLLDLRSERPRRVNIGAWTAERWWSSVCRLAWEGLVLGVPFDMEKPPVSNLQISDVTADRHNALSVFQSPFSNRWRPSCWWQPLASSS